MTKERDIFGNELTTGSLVAWASCTGHGKNRIKFGVIVDMNAVNNHTPCIGIKPIRCRTDRSDRFEFRPKTYLAAEGLWAIRQKSQLPMMLQNLINKVQLELKDPTPKGPAWHDTYTAEFAAMIQEELKTV